MSWFAIVLAALSLVLAIGAAVVAARAADRAAALETRVGHLETLGFQWERETRREAAQYQVRVYADGPDLLCENGGSSAVYDVDLTHDPPADGTAPLVERLALKFPCEQLHPGSVIRIRGNVDGNTARSLRVHWRWIDEGGARHESSATVRFEAAEAATGARRGTAAE